MLFDISDVQFKNIMKNPNLSLPIRWDGKDFETAIANLLDEYMSELHALMEENDEEPHHGCIRVDISEIETISALLKLCIHEYHQGFPATAFGTLKKIMKYLMKTPLRVYQKSNSLELLEADNLYLFRLREINDTAKHMRKDLFHVPSCARSMISTCRYSIAGYPSLYLTTSVELGMEEIGNPNNNVLISRFKIIRTQKVLKIRVLELGIKPQDFYKENPMYLNSNHSTRNLDGIDLMDNETRSNYLRWYPLIAACSYIRVKKSCPFSSEYIIPQLLMQWVRKQIRTNELMGIRYFSCASIRASELGFDYVFPVNNTNYEEGYCSVLRDSFLLTNPVYLRDFDSVHQCERYLIDCNDFDKI